MTLTEFLLARIADNEADAQQSEHDLDRWERETTRNGADGSQGSIVASNLRGGALDPQRVLADCEAKRRIVERLHVAGPLAPGWSDFILQSLALPYADYSDYQEDR